jgi:hypothetical protein
MPSPFTAFLEGTVVELSRVKGWPRAWKLAPHLIINVGLLPTLDLIGSETDLAPRCNAVESKKRSFVDPEQIIHVILPLLVRASG